METIHTWFIRREKENRRRGIYNNGENRPSLTKEEVPHAVKLAKDNKTTGPDEIPAEIIKLITEDQIIKDLYNIVYDTSVIPKDSTTTKPLTE